MNETWQQQQKNTQEIKEHYLLLELNRATDQIWNTRPIAIE